ncbi:APC family permease [Nonomuraea longicatena]|uniref:APC family permease n=1 Tax=Nonomuraea longicatena TaxID=83682 RepID=A0ABP4A2Y2_9ACTN
MTKAALPERLGYRAKCLLLGPPLVTSELRRERMPKRVALGVLSSDCVSSSAYGPEQILVALVPAVGVAAFALIMPITAVVLAVLALLTLTYRDLVTVFSQAGGSYVVARESFGRDVAQVAAVALLIDYTVTVAVQASAGTDALLSMIHLIGDSPTAYGLDAVKSELTIGVVVLMCYLNLRGAREAGRLLAVPFYLFAGSVGLVVVAGLARILVEGGLPHAPSAPGVIPPGQPGEGLLYGASLFILLRAFANGGSSLTGLEAISNGVGAFKEPTGPNARTTMTVMSCTLAVLVGGIAVLAHYTHALPYTDGSPTVLAQEARLVFGEGGLGTAVFVFVQLATALILYTGGNTSFTGFPYLASFVAEDRFLPRALTRRGHRLAFSNGILALTAVSIVLLLVTRSSVQQLVALYAIGVFTSFTMGSAGLCRHHWVGRGPGWRRKVVLTAVTAMVCALVVLIFAVTKFTEGAWLVVVAFPLGVWALIRINRRYRAEAAALSALHTPAEPLGPPTAVLVLVNSVDLAALKALRYGLGLRPKQIKAAHIAVDRQLAERLQRTWTRVTGLPLDLVDCPDRRVATAAARLASSLGSDVTVLIPHGIYAPVIGRLMHGWTADHIARHLARVPGVTPLVIPYDVVDVR